MANIINGADVMLLLNNKSIACATSHTLTLSTTMVDQTAPGHKDIGTVTTKVTWAESTPQSNSWTAATENLFTTDTAYGYTQVDLFDIWHDGTELTAYFGIIDPHNAVTSGGYTKSNFLGGSYFYTGKMHITNLTENAPYEGKATFTAEFEGNGELKKVYQEAQPSQD